MRISRRGRRIERSRGRLICLGVRSRQSRESMRKRRGREWWWIEKRRRGEEIRSRCIEGSRLKLSNRSSRRCRGWRRWGWWMRIRRESRMSFRSRQRRYYCSSSMKWIRGSRWWRGKILRDESRCRSSRDRDRVSQSRRE